MTEIKERDAGVIVRRPWPHPVRVEDATADEWIRRHDRELGRGEMAWTVSGDTLVAVSKNSEGILGGYVCRVANSFSIEKPADD